MRRSEAELARRLLRLFACTAALSVGRMAGGCQPAQAQPERGHRVTNNRITVNTAAHWRNWHLPSHAVDVDASGRVRPRFFRGRYNVLDDLGTFSRRLTALDRRRGQRAILNIDSTWTLDARGNPVIVRQDTLFSYFVRPGISRVGSNPEAAANILDGDPDSFWEPAPDDPEGDWWIEVDLGRVVTVEEVVLRFVEEGRGDPFRQFRVLAARNQDLIQQQANKVEFEVVAGTKAPNLHQRTFRLSLDERNAADRWTGRMVETIRIVVTESKRGRGTRVSEAAWQELDPGDRGDIVYHVRDVDGIEDPISRSVYENLPSERRGRREFYLRERPRLADIEVWGWGDNIGLGIVEGGGSLLSSSRRSSSLPGWAFDGDFDTFFSHPAWRPAQGLGELIVDMGAVIWLDGVRMSSRADIPGYSLQGSLGARGIGQKLEWNLIAREAGTRLLLSFSDLRCCVLVEFDPSPKLRFLRILMRTDIPPGGYFSSTSANEYQLFSEGFPAAVTLTSDLIALPAAREHGGITWIAETPPGTGLEIRTRTGDVLSRSMRYFDRSGAEITQDAWGNLLGSFKGPIDTTFSPGSGWSPWSSAYQQQGERVTSPGQRRFMQIQVRMATTDRNAAAAVNSIDIDLVDPAAERVLAELWPTEVETAGRRDTFDVFVRPTFVEAPAASRSSGFDEILVTMPASQDLELLEVEIGPGDGQPEQVFWPSDDRVVFVDAQGARVELLSERSDSIWVRLPALLNLLPNSPRAYNRITSEGEQVPATQGGLLLTAAIYGTLQEDEKGDVRYFRRTVDALGQAGLREVDRLAYQSLAANEQGPIRYFRILRGDGGQYPFDASGDTLSATSYGRLPRSERGMVVGDGQLIRLRFSAPIFLRGTTLRIAVRNSGDGTDPAAPWQSAEPGDATDRVHGNTLSISVPISAKLLDGFSIAPNPFTPNGDGINDETHIGVSVLQISAPRQLSVRIYGLDGRRYWLAERVVGSGRESIRWAGRDLQGRQVPPGIYICQLRLDADAKDAESIALSRLVSVVY